ncbi:MAG: DUF433 domain-containing protein [Chloroflexota bacterium]|nr:DUF433 domain-containing protein [Chloroflexota bacterium]
MTDQELIDTYIEPDPNKPGIAEARIVGYGVHVWALIGYLEAVHGDIDRTAEDYELPRETVEAACAYYRRHKEVIDARLAANAA